MPDKFHYDAHSANEGHALRQAPRNPFAVKRRPRRGVLKRIPGCQPAYEDDTVLIPTDVAIKLLTIATRSR